MAGICAAHGIFYILFYADPYHTGRTVRGVYRMSACLKCEYWHLCTIELCIEDEVEDDELV